MERVVWRSGDGESSGGEVMNIRLEARRWGKNCLEVR